MAKEKIAVNSIYELSSVKENNLLPIYFFTGSDRYTIDIKTKEIEAAAKNLISSDFDKETINAEKGVSFTSILDIAFAFPFGDGKKLVIVKDQGKFDDEDKKNFLAYIKDPPSTTILVVQYPGTTPSYKSEPFSKLIEKNYLFEAGELKGQALLKWLVSQVNSMKMRISDENARLLVDMVGEDKSLLEMHLRKFFDFAGSDSEITSEIIKNNTAKTKENTIFELQDAIAHVNKKSAFNIASNLVDQGLDSVYILTILTKYFLTILRSLELIPAKTEREAAKDLEVHEFYLKKLLEARHFRNEKRLSDIFKILQKYDLEIKTRSYDEKTLVFSLISEILSA